MKDPRRIPEHALQATLVAFLRVSCRKGVMWHAIPNELPKIEERARKFAAMGMKAGVGDFIFSIDRLTHYLEIKTENGRQSKDQKAFEIECEFAKIPYELVRSFERAREVLDQWGALKRSATRRAA